MSLSVLLSVHVRRTEASLFVALRFVIAAGAVLSLESAGVAVTAVPVLVLRLLSIVFTVKVYSVAFASPVTVRLDVVPVRITGFASVPVVAGVALTSTP